eukprot:80179_1
MASASLLSTAWKLVTCISILEFDNKNVHFYDASRECYDFSWFVGIFVIICICVFWLGLFIIISKQNSEQRQNESDPYYKFHKPFQQKVWFFEFVLFIRRFLISALTASNYTIGSYSN